MARRALFAWRLDGAVCGDGSGPLRTACPLGDPLVELSEQGVLALSGDREVELCVFRPEVAIMLDQVSRVATCRIRPLTSVWTLRG